MKLDRLVPMLPVKSMPVSVAFYQKLGFGVEAKDDNWGWAMLSLDECRLMVDQSISEGPHAARRSVLYFYPENLGDYHQMLRAAGLSVPDVSITLYGMDEFRIQDPDGNQLWIGQAQPKKS